MNQLALVNPQEYFREQISEASENMNLRLLDEVEFYLVNLMCEFIDPYKSGIYTDQANHDTPLALTLKKALEAPPSEKIRLLKQLGDSSLYLAGYFQEGIKGSVVDVSYYIAIGSNAYDKLSNLIHDNSFVEVYRNLAEDFTGLVDLLDSIATPYTKNNKDLLKVYERWTKYQSDNLRKALEAEGINPTDIVTPQSKKNN